MTTSITMLTATKTFKRTLLLSMMISGNGCLRDMVGNRLLENTLDNHSMEAGCKLKVSSFKLVVGF